MRDSHELMTETCRNEKYLKLQICIATAALNSPSLPRLVPPAQVEDGRPVRDDVRRPEGGGGLRAGPPHR